MDWDNLVLDIGSGGIPHGDIQIDLPSEQAQKHHGRPVIAPTIYCDAHSLPFRDNTIKKVLMLHVLEHLYCPLLVLKEVKRILQNNGSIRIEIPNPRCWDRERDEHLYSWHPCTFQNIVREAGFREIQYYPYDSESSQNQAIDAKK